MFNKGDRVDVLIHHRGMNEDQWFDGFTITARVAAVDRVEDFRYDVEHDNGTVFREIAPECVRPESS